MASLGPITLKVPTSYRRRVEWSHVVSLIIVFNPGNSNCWGIGGEVP